VPKELVELDDATMTSLSCCFVDFLARLRVRTRVKVRVRLL